MNEAEKNKAAVNGVVVSGAGVNIDEMVKGIREFYETPDKHGKTRATHFEPCHDDAGEVSYVNFWAN